MGTCPKCKLRIRKNGNHTQAGLGLVSQDVPGQARSHRQELLVPPDPLQPRGTHSLAPPAVQINAGESPSLDDLSRLLHE